jgi:site-specific recombinase XerD
MGSCRHPQPELIRQVTGELLRLTSEKDEIISYNATMVWMAYIAVLLTGVRIFEWVRINRMQLDFAYHLIPLLGKPNFAKEANRFIFLIGSSTLISAWLEIAYRKTKEIVRQGHFPHSSKGLENKAFLFITKNGLSELSVGESNEFLQMAARQAGLNEVQQFKLQDLRHVAKSGMVERLLPGDVIDALLGHQETGREINNLYREESLIQSIEQIREFMVWQGERFGLQFPDGDK